MNNAKNKITRNNFKQYISIIYPVVLIFIIGLALYHFPFHFVPDYLKLKNYSKLYELFNLIITSLTSLIGIYVSVSLVAHAIFKEKSGLDFHKSFLINSINSLYISYSVSTIIFSFLCSIVIPISKPSNNELTLIYYNVFLFISIIILLFPVAFNLFSSLKTEQIASKEISKISVENIFIKPIGDNDFDEIQYLFENDHLLKTQEIILALISVREKIKAQSIIFKASRKVSELIIYTEEKNKKYYLISRLISFYINIIDFTLLQPNNTTLLRNIWLSIENIYSIIIERKDTIVHFENFRKEFFERFFNRLFEYNKDELINEGITSVKRIIQNQILYNMPSDDKILFLDTYRRMHDNSFEERQEYTDEYFKIDAHWREAAYEFMGIFSIVMNKAISTNKPEIINKCSEEINKLTFKFRLKNTGIYKQFFFYIHASNIISDVIYRAFEREVFLEGSDAKNLTPSLFEEMIRERHPAARTVLCKYCYWLMSIQKLNKLDFWLLGGLTIGDFITLEGELGGISKSCAIHYKEAKEIQDCLSDCIITFDNIKIYFEKYPPRDLGLYFQIKKQFENILYWLNDKKVDDLIIIDNLKGLINSFKENL